MTSWADVCVCVILLPCNPNDGMGLVVTGPPYRCQACSRPLHCFPQTRGTCSRLTRILAIQRRLSLHRRRVVMR
ncbi:hypothetical protein Micbo1qcDRAFT_18005 [Microdochium bolleyi]|uniref:Uncharacterized protein n=1 Tax=Microdochium bolleyi TaxID=196109 RepID=A0A136IUQ3_9PEZI|nr:hypothetical protein Micbo1qcDRAFT_18005 [Microdochium bolleyi]